MVVLMMTKRKFKFVIVNLINLLARAKLLELYGVEVER